MNGRPVNKADKLYNEWKTKFDSYGRGQRFGFRRRVVNYAKSVEANSDEAQRLREIGLGLELELVFKNGSSEAGVIKRMMAPVWRVQLIRDPNSPASSRTQITSPQEARNIFTSYLEGLDREHFVVMLLDTKNKVIGLNTVSIGTVNSALVTARETFKPALLANATAVILGHNHPSGDPTPSPEDVTITRQLVKAGKVLDIEVLDHLIIGEAGRYRSLKESGLGF